MSIEETLSRLADALEANTDALHQLMKTGGGAASAGGSTKASGSSTKASGSAGKSTGKATTKTKGETTAEQVAERVTAYLKTGSKAEREERKTHVKRIIDHYDVDRFTNIDPENFDEALGMLKQFEEGEDPFGGDGADEDGEDGAMV